MKDKEVTTSDSRNRGFGISPHTAEQKPGFEAAAVKTTAASGHHKAVRREAKEPKSISQVPLAKRIVDAKKGNK